MHLNQLQQGWLAFALQDPFSVHTLQGGSAVQSRPRARSGPGLEMQRATESRPAGERHKNPRRTLARSHNAPHNNTRVRFRVVLDAVVLGDAKSVLQDSKLHALEPRGGPEVAPAWAPAQFMGRPYQGHGSQLGARTGTRGSRPVSWSPTRRTAAQAAVRCMGTTRD